MKAALFAIPILLAAGAGIWRLTNQPVARAQSGCSAATLQGSYGYVTNGFFYDANGFQGIYAASGRAVFDGTGAITGTESHSMDGVPARGVQFSGTYTVNADCTGSINAGSNIDFVVTNGGKQITLVSYDPDFIVSGTATLQ
ncbi:MAG: hypothetical protein IT167_06420 [Bryobacterales bacterium]|nr:hypothetical protein [Bryobacterales bacterium]